MGNEEVWEKFLPKVRRVNYNSNLSQMSTSSCMSKDGRLSLSSRVFARDSLQVGRPHQSPAVTPPRPSVSKFSSPKSSLKKNGLLTPKVRTPSTTRKSSTKKNTPSDGKTQKNLLSYFSVSATKKPEPLQVRLPVVEEITLDSSSDDEDYSCSVKIREKLNERNTVLSTGVSRVLFPSVSTTSANERGEVVTATHSSISPDRDQNKENRLSPPVSFTKFTDSVEKSLKERSDVISTCKNRSVPEETEQDRRTNLQTSLAPPETKIPTHVKSPDRADLHCSLEQRNTLLPSSKRACELTVEDASTAECRQKCKTNQQATLTSPAAVAESEIHHSTDGPCMDPPPVPAANCLSGSHQKSQDNFYKGKKKMDISEVSEDSGGGVISLSKSQKKTKVPVKSSAELMRSEIRKNLEETFPITHSQKGCSSQHKSLVDTRKFQTLNDPLENFTGVTECISLESSGEIWTPRGLSSSSDDFDDSNMGKAHAPKVSCAKRTTRDLGKNKQSRCEKSKKQVSKSRSTLKQVKKDTVKTSVKETSQSATEVKSVAAANESSTSKKSGPCMSSGKYISPASSSEAECFSNSGGFFSEEVNVNRIAGQAFVIKSPSVEYLQNYASLDDGSFVIEKDNECDDCESERSSVLADLNDIVNSGLETLNKNGKDEFSEKTTNVDSRSEEGGNFSSSTMPAGNDVQNIIYLGSLRGVTLTESEWDMLPSQSKGRNESRETRTSMNNTCESLASNLVSFKARGARIDSTFSSQCEMVKSKQSSQDLLSEKAISPSEAAEAPYNATIAGSKQSACQPGVNGEATMSFHSYGLSSQSTEIRLSSAIEPIPQREVIQTVSPNKEDFEGRLASTQKVVDWFSKLEQNPGGIGVRPHKEFSPSEETVSFGEESSVFKKANKGARNGFLGNNGKVTPGQNVKLSSPGKFKVNTKHKSCKITCHVRVLVTHSYKISGGGLDIKRKKCVIEKNCQKNTENYLKASAILTAEVFELSEVLSLRPQCRNSTHLPYNSNRVENGSSVSSSKEHDLKNILVTSKVSYGKWGWDGIGIECLDGECSDVDMSVERSKRSCLSIEKVCITLCNCSRSLFVECVVLQKENDVGCTLVGRSKFNTSLKGYESCWGVPDSPVMLSVTTYSEISKHGNKKLISNGAGLANPSVEMEPDLPDSLSQLLQFVNEDTSKTATGTNGRNAEGKRKSPPLQCESSQIMKDAASLSLSDMDDSILTDSSDIGWMTQEGEASKHYAVDQWKSLMKKMREGGKSVASSTKSTSVSTDTISLSFISTSSQGTNSNASHAGRARYGQERRPKVCPFYKKVQGTRFAVDAFNYGQIPGITHYFLSHFHYDHYMGLNKKFSLPIYCSSVTANLVILKLQVSPSLIRRIDPGQTIKIDGVIVTALDANHCPGSLMLLFQLPGGKSHLHVGDFRAHIGMESFQAFWNVHIDQLYLDTTYCNPTYSFSSQERVIDNILTIVESAVMKDPKTLFVCGSYTIGKERVFAAIAERFQFKIWAPTDKRKVLECVKKGLLELHRLDKDSPDISEGGAARELELIGALSMLSMVKEDSKIHVLPMSKLKAKCLQDHLYSMKSLGFTNIVAFRPTGWAHGRMKGNSESNLVFNSPSVKIYEVAYSEHSSFQEMARFVKFIKPERVVKTVLGSAKERDAMDVHINSWLKEAHSKVPLPNRSSDSPKSFLVAAKQRDAGDFISGKRKNLLGRRLPASQESVFKLLASGHMQNTSESNSFRGSDLGSKELEERTSYGSQLHYGANKRVGSPIGLEMTPKKHRK